MCAAMPHRFEYHNPTGSAKADPPPLTQLFRGARTHLRIHLLRLPGIEIADETGKLPLPDTAVQILLRTHWLPCVRGAVSEAD